MGGDPWQAIQMYQVDRDFASVPILSEERCFVMGLDCVKPSLEEARGFVYHCGPF